MISYSSELKLVRLKASEGGIYTFQASNSDASVNQTFIIFVISKLWKIFCKIRSFCSKDHLSASHNLYLFLPLCVLVHALVLNYLSYLLHLDNLSCLLGKPEIVSHEGPVDGQVRCVAKGFPAPQIKWYYCEQPYIKWEFLKLFSHL